MTSEAEISAVEEVDVSELADLYGSVGWGAYTQDLPALARAVNNSTYVVTARIDGGLVGLARGLSDEVSVFYLQDILVNPQCQRQGIGRALMEACLERFEHVHTKLLLTDDLTAQHRFYEAMGYGDIRNVSDVKLHAFVLSKGVEFENSSGQSDSI